MKKFVQKSESLLKKGMVPDFLIRIGIRRLLKETLQEHINRSVQDRGKYLADFLEQLKNSPIALDTSAANEQHYEVPTEFFQLCLGKHLKYSCGYWHDGIKDIDVSEEDMLDLYIERGDLKDGQAVLELGCGWGSLSLHIAQRFPNSDIVGVSNSKTQKEFIDAQAQQRGVRNLRIITADMNTFDIDQKFDRAVSIEMFEHMRNYQKLLEKISGFLKEGGKLFVHIFAHREFPYFYEAKSDSDWIAKYFFTGGVMPSHDLLLNFQDNFVIENNWVVNGKHYQKTSEAWLKKMDNNKEKICRIFKETYGESEYKKWWNYWRIFFMSCAELWGYQGGTEWIVSHYRFRKR